MRIDVMVVAFFVFLSIVNWAGNETKQLKLKLEIEQCKCVK